MKIIITNKQHKLIMEALGVPDSILDAAEEFYEIFLGKLKSINDTEDKYNFDGNVDIRLGDKKKIKIKEYTLEVDTHVVDSFDETAKVVSMAMGQQFNFDRTIYMKRTKETTTANFAITYVVSSDWTPNELYDEFYSDKDEHIASLAHELKHFYDKQVKPIDLVGHDVDYQATQQSPRFGIPVIDEKFLRFLYYATMAESLVRPTEVASSLRTKKITKSQFKEFLKQNRTYQSLTELKNFTYEQLIEGLYNNMDRIDEIMEMTGSNPSSMTEQEKVDNLLKLVYVNLGNSKIRLFDKYTEDKSFGGLFGLMSIFGNMGDDDEKLDKIRKQFIKYILKYEKNPKQFFKDEIKKFQMVADKMIRKIAKLYDMAKDDVPVSESIIDWDLHAKLMKQKYGKIHFETEIKKKK
jgi:UDP-2,3-diacylglucosamine pyrophosphatase LpxH